MRHAVDADCVLTDVWISMSDAQNNQSISLKDQEKINSLSSYKSYREINENNK